jgi:hypothetical protein
MTRCLNIIDGRPVFGSWMLRKLKRYPIRRYHIRLSKGLSGHYAENFLTMYSFGIPETWTESLKNSGISITVIVYMPRLMAIRHRKSAGKLSSVELISTNSVGKHIVAGYSNYRSQPELQFAMHRIKGRASRARASGNAFSL